MSAFIVDPEHVAALVRFYAGTRASQLEHDPERHDVSWEETCANRLYAENVRSVNHRYEDSTPDEPIVFTSRQISTARRLTPVEAIKACHCLEYQSCEHPEWKESRACALLHRILRVAINELPGYEEAPWEIERTVAK